MGIKFYPEPSTFKQQLNSMKPGDQIIAGQLAGDFVLPKDRTRKLVFLAGGIGVTPFRSMIKEMLDADTNAENSKNVSKAVRRDIALLYSARTASDLAYKSLFDEASRRLGIKVIYVTGDAPAPSVTTSDAVSNQRNEEGNERAARWIRAALLDVQTITKEVPDYKERIFYISGPNAMVTAFQNLLKNRRRARNPDQNRLFPWVCLRFA